MKFVSVFNNVVSASDGPFPARYEHEVIEPKWQRYWAERETFKVCIFLKDSKMVESMKSDEISAVYCLLVVT
jgi:hypothetical protein